MDINIVSQVLARIASKAGKKVQRGLSVHKEHEILLKLESAGLNNELAQKVIGAKNNELAREIVSLIRDSSLEKVSSHKAAEEIMGINFFGVEDATEYLEIKPTRKQIFALAEIPFSKDFLEARKNTHILTAYLPNSLVEMCESKQFAKIVVNDNHEEPWFKKTLFGWRMSKCGWYLIRKQPLDSMFNIEFAVQRMLLAPNESVANVDIMVYTAVGHFLKTELKMFGEGMVRCAELDPSGRRVTVGPFKKDGLRIQCWWDTTRCHYVGLATTIKPW